jgi:MFS family permease
MGIGPMQMLAWFTPMAGGGCLLALVGGRLMHVVSGTIVLILTSIAVVISSALFICVPRDPSYWAWIFPAMVCATIAIDLVYSVVNVFLSSNLPEHQQGLAGSLAHALVQFSGALFLALAKFIMTSTSSKGDAKDYTNVFWLQFFSGIAAFMIFSIFVRVDKAKDESSLAQVAGLEDSIHIAHS